MNCEIQRDDVAFEHKIDQICTRMSITALRNVKITSVEGMHVPVGKCVCVCIHTHMHTYIFMYVGSY